MSNGYYFFICINEEENIVSNKTDKNRNKSVSQYEVGAADLEKVSGGTEKLVRKQLQSSDLGKGVRERATKPRRQPQDGMASQRQ